MDKTPEHIKMCEKAKELQKDFKPEDDFSWVQQGWCTKHKSFIQHWYEGEVKCIEEPEGPIWDSRESQEKHCHSEEDWIVLFRQDQLQGMVNENINYTIALNGFSCIPYLEIEKIFSWEQLWLAFVMNQLYQKRWSNGEWIKI